MQLKGITLIVAVVLLAVSSAHAQQILKTYTLSSEFSSAPGMPRAARNPVRDVWLVAWRQGQRILARELRGNGGFGLSRVLASGVSTSEQDFDLQYDSFRNRYALVFETSSALRLQWFTAGLQKAGPAVTLAGSAGGSSPAMTTGSSGPLIFWLDSAGSTVMTGGGGLVRASSGTSFSALKAALNPKDGSVLVTLLQKDSRGRAALHGYQVNADGALRRNTPLVFQPPSAGLESAGSAAFAADGTAFAVWSYGSALKYRKVAPSGSFPSPARSFLGATGNDSVGPAIVFDESGEQFLAVWPNAGRIRSAAWNLAGAVRTQPFDVAASDLEHARNAVASGDSRLGNVLSVWEDVSEPGRVTRRQIRASLFFPGTPGNEMAVAIGDNFFSPKSLTIRPGTLVTWTNQGFNAHTVTSGTPVSQLGTLFDSSTIAHAQKFSFRFTRPGTIPYFCRVHGSTQSGTIQVVEGSP